MKLLIFILTIIPIISHIPPFLLSSHYDPTTNITYYFDKELEPAILSGIVEFLTYQSEENLFYTYVLSDPPCASVFTSYKSDIKILTTNYFGSGLTFAGLGLEEECYETNKNFLYLTYIPISNSTTAIAEQIHVFLERKNKTIGLCLDAHCAKYYKEMLNMKKNAKFNEYLVNEHNISGLYLQKSLFNTSQLMKDIQNVYKFSTLDALIWIVITCFIIRILFTFIGYIMSSTAEEDAVTDDDFDTKSLSKSEVGDWARESETLLFPSKQKQTNVLVEFMISLSFVESFRELFQLRCKLFDEKDIVLISGIRVVMFMFVMVAQNCWYMVKQPHKTSAIVNLFKPDSYFIVKFSIYAFEGIKILNGVLFGYKLISYIRKLDHRKESFNVKNMLKFYMKCLVYVISFIFIFFCIQQLFLEIGMKVKPSAYYEYFSKELKENMECLRHPWVVFIPFYLQYYSKEIGYTNQTCFKTAFFTLSEFYCFTAIILITYLFLKIKVKIIETLFYIANFFLIFFAYFISVERNTILGKNLTFTIVDGPSETLALPHMFFLFYFVGFNIGIMFYFWVNLENVYTEYSDILVGKKTNIYLPFEYNLHLMKFFSKPAQWVKTIFAIVFGLLLFIAPIIFSIRLGSSQELTLIPTITKTDTFFYVYEPIFYSMMFSFCVIFIMMSDRGSFILNFFRSKLFIGINRIFFACFNLFNFITQLFHGSYNADMYLSVANIFECAFTITFLTLIIGIVYVIMIEIVLRILYKMMFHQRNEPRTFSTRIKQEGLFPNE